MCTFDFRLVINYEINIDDRYKKGNNVCSEARCVINRVNRLYKQEAVLKVYIYQCVVRTKE